MTDLAATDLAADLEACSTMSTSAAHLDGIEIGMTLRIGTKAGLNPAPDGADSIQISELAERIGTTPRAIRYYEELNLITPHRTQAGARTYCPDTRRTLEVIVTLRRAGASVDQIRHILAGPTNRENQHQEVSAALQARLCDLHGQIEHVKLLLARFA